MELYDVLATEQYTSCLIIGMCKLAVITGCAVELDCTWTATRDRPDVSMNGAWHLRWLDACFLSTSVKFKLACQDFP